MDSFVLYLCSFLFVIMDTFSLEDDEDVSNMFITQTPSSNSQNVTEKEEENDADDMFLGLLENDFQSPCSSLVQKDHTVFNYSDISDEEFVDNVKTSTPIERQDIY